MGWVFGVGSTVGLEIFCGARGVRIFEEGFAVVFVGVRGLLGVRYRVFVRFAVRVFVARLLRVGVGWVGVGWVAHAGPDRPVAHKIR